MYKTGAVRPRLASAQRRNIYNYGEKEAWRRIELLTKLQRRDEAKTLLLLYIFKSQISGKMRGSNKSTTSNH